MEKNSIPLVLKRANFSCKPKTLFTAKVTSLIVKDDTSQAALTCRTKITNAYFFGAMLGLAGVINDVGTTTSLLFLGFFVSLLLLI